jgi:hypothetical protein
MKKHTLDAAKAAADLQAMSEDDLPDGRRARRIFHCSPQPQGKHHMSLEDRISENTEALRALTIALAANHVPAVGPKSGPGKPLRLRPSPRQPRAAALDYEKDVKPLALRVAKDKGREKLIEILGEFKVAQANLLKAEQWGEFITACNKALA